MVSHTSPKPHAGMVLCISHTHLVESGRPLQVVLPLWQRPAPLWCLCSQTPQLLRLRCWQQTHQPARLHREPLNRWQSHCCLRQLQTSS